jgi:hypothetical protein
MSTSPIAPVVDHHPVPFRELSAYSKDHDVSIHREPPERTGPEVEGGAAVRSAPLPHRSAAAAMIRGLGGRTESALRRELDRFFVARPDLSHADRVAIARTMSRFRNQLLHHPRSTMRAAAATDPTGAHLLIDAVRSLFKLHDTPVSDQSDRHRPWDRSADVHVGRAFSPTSPADRRRPRDRSADPVPKESTYQDF